MINHSMFQFVWRENENLQTNTLAFDIKDLYLFCRLSLMRDLCTAQND